MKAYVITSGTTFGLIVVAHIWRIVVEGPALVMEPVFILVTLTAAIFSIWSLRVLSKISGTRDQHAVSNSDRAGNRN